MTKEKVLQEDNLFLTCMHLLTEHQIHDTKYVRQGEIYNPLF